MDHDWIIKSCYVDVLHGDCLKRLRRMRSNCIDSVVSDPPYELGFMGKHWDSQGIANSVELWSEVYRVLKPGGYLAAFSATRTQHRMVCAIEDAGFEIRDQIHWIYGSGFPKSLDVAKALDKKAGHWRGRSGEVTITKQPSKGTEYERNDKGKPITESAKQWEGWGTALKPAHEPICLARKPLIGSVTDNVLEYGTGVMNIDACRVSGSSDKLVRPSKQTEPIGRWPANVVHDGSDVIVKMFPNSGNGNNGDPYQYSGKEYNNKNTSMFNGDKPQAPSNFNDSGSAARFFYSSKASKHDRLDSDHPTVKPVSLLRWLNKLITPPNGVILDPFAGTGTMGIAALLEGFDCVLIEREDEYVKDIVNRFQRYMKKYGKRNLFKTQDRPR